MTTRDELLARAASGLASARAVLAGELGHDWADTYQADYECMEAANEAIALLREPPKIPTDIAALLDQVEQQARRIAELEKALAWTTHIMCGVSMDGGSDISQQEYSESVDAAKAALKGTPR